MAWSLLSTFQQIVMRGLDPRIHLFAKSLTMMDCRVKPGNDELIASTP
jgi:hypothetical protein